MVDAVLQAVAGDVPVTVKMRRGSDDSPEAEARFWTILEGAIARGITAATVHPRTVAQKYVGPSRWPFLARVKAHVGAFPILGSGDLFSAFDVLAMLRDLKGEDAEGALEDMIGRTVKQLQADPNGEDALAALRKLTVCKGGFTFEAAEAFGAADSLKPLRRRGLVRVENERYEIDPLVIAAVGEPGRAGWATLSAA